MRINRIISLLTNTYRLSSPNRLLEISSIRRAYVFAYFQYKKLFEDPFWNLAKRQPHIFRNGDILDIGANIGYTACVFARAIKKGSTVFAFEPDQLSYNILNEVVGRKGLSATIEIINTAVGNSNGYVKFWHNTRHPADHRVATERFKELRPDNAKFSTIPVITIDSFVANRGLQNISFIKIDVQGYELAVCEGMTNTLERFPDLCVCLEYCPNAMAELGFEPSKLLDFFRINGYKLYTLQSGNPKLLDDSISIQETLKDVDYADLLFSKRVSL
jgi:FkbM family methyltransferase